jgi:hypothetical protein
VADSSYEDPVNRVIFVNLLQFVSDFLTAKMKKPPSASLLTAGAAGRWQVPTRFISILQGILPYLAALKEIFFTRPAFSCSSGIAAASLGPAPQEKQIKFYLWENPFAN